jgi:hypothetical protein
MYKLKYFLAMTDESYYKLGIAFLNSNENGHLQQMKVAQVGTLTR